MLDHRVLFSNFERVLLTELSIGLVESSIEIFSVNLQLLQIVGVMLLERLGQASIQKVVNLFDWVFAHAK